MAKKYHVQSQPRMFEQVARQISDYIHSERLAPGSKLPTERQLSELLQVSRSSVREGIRVLELLRILDSKQGEGTFVATPPPYIIPYRIIEQKPVAEDYRHYLEVALMCAEKILELTIQQNQPYAKTLSGQNFWENLLVFLSNLGGQLENPYYGFLWTETFQLVIQAGDLSQRPAPFDFCDFVNAYQKGDMCRLKKWLNLLSDNI